MGPVQQGQTCTQGHQGRASGWIIGGPPQTPRPQTTAAQDQNHYAKDRPPVRDKKPRKKRPKIFLDNCIVEDPLSGGGVAGIGVLVPVIRHYCWFFHFLLSMLQFSLCVYVSCLRNDYEIARPPHMSRQRARVHGFFRKTHGAQHALSPHTVLKVREG